METEAALPPAIGEEADNKLLGVTDPLSMENNTCFATEVREEVGERNNDCIIQEESLDSIVVGGGVIVDETGDKQNGGIAIHVADEVLTEPSNEGGATATNEATPAGHVEDIIGPLDVEETTAATLAALPNPGSSALENTSPNLPRGENVAPTTPPATQVEAGVADSNSSEYLLLGLPIDSLHSIASFLPPKDFCSFGLCSKGANKVCREVFRRVRMHGFRCATEVVTAWKMNQHSDAKELCALYIGSGVPIYPHSLGHSYHTLVWRMGIEAQEMERVLNSVEAGGERLPDDASGGRDNAEGEATARTPVDRFFAERYETRGREGLNYAISYLEEKSLYMLNADQRANDANSFAQSVRRQMSMAPNRFAVRPPHNAGNAHMADGGHVHGDAGRAPHVLRLVPTESASVGSDLARRGVTRSTSQSDLRGRGPKVVVKVHRHLLDQHLLGRPCVDDRDGMMTTAPVNLSADFFHPHFKFHAISARNASALQEPASKFTSSDGFVSGELLPAWNHQMTLPQAPGELATLGIGDLLTDPVAGMGHELPLAENADDSDSDGEHVNQQVLHAAENIFEPPTGALDSALARRAQGAAVPLRGEPLAVNNHYSTPTHPNILVNVDLEVYSASSTNTKVDSVLPESREIRNHLRARFAAYQRRLESLLSQHDSHGFDESILDFWDEFLPQTAGIQYYDRHTAVPRISCLHKFLTKPCPKAIGVVQCEIERIKLGPKKKGVNMKGRFFPTYEYRLFIRHRPPEAMDGSEPPRRDTVLMMAKNRGRKHVESSSSTVSSKKGANNYFLYIPQQDDVEQHFKSVNSLDIPSKSVTNGASNRPMPTDGPTLMGRLQSNFIGTEFQIFTPQAAKKGQGLKSSPKRSYTTPVNTGLNHAGSSEDDYGYDSGVSSDNPSSSGRRRSRFGRLSLRRNGGTNPPEPTTIAEDESHAKPLRRSRSSGDMNEGSRRTRTSRRAIANNSEGLEKERCQPMLLEEEDGAITYTANLLGSRPRIMDVCIPKVSPDGQPGAEWKKYLDKCLPEAEGGAGNRMLNHLKQIQQRMENEEQGIAPRLIQESDFHSTDDYSPPDDFGLLALQNRPPWWNIELGSFVLNFGGRVSVASVKNFQLCDRNDQDYIMLQFGRIQGRHSFTMDFQHPLTAVQAFAIAISSLQSKISFG